MNTSGYQLRFRSLFDPGRGFVFPCDAEGHVDIDALSPHALNNYLYARTVVGREFFTPAVEISLHRERASDRGSRAASRWSSRHRFDNMPA
jgi:hypothetical protein